MFFESVGCLQYSSAVFLKLGSVVPWGLTRGSEDCQWAAGGHRRLSDSLLYYSVSLWIFVSVKIVRSKPVLSFQGILGLKKFVVGDRLV